MHSCVNEKKKGGGTNMEVTKSVDDSVFFKPKKPLQKQLLHTPPKKKPNLQKYLMTD